MKKVLVLGAGMVARPLVRYLLDRTDFGVTVADCVPARAEELVGDHPRGAALPLDVEDAAALDSRVREGGDVVVSLVPYAHHVAVARACLRHGRHLVTASYVSPAMGELDAAARKAGLLFLNELGLDPGLDHMSALRVIRRVVGEGGRIVSFRSYCGGLPAPEANDNPFGYKFSWSPRGVVMAARNAARYLEDGGVVEVPGPELFEHHWPVEVPATGTFEAYPNRDSLPYLETYGIQGARTLLRGTLRHPGWCRAWRGIGQLGYLGDATLPPPPPEGVLTFGRLTAHLIGSQGRNVRAEAASFLGLPLDSDVLDRLEWLGLFGNEPVPPGSRTPMDVLCARLTARLAYRPGERDMVVLFHEFQAEYPDGTARRITSTLLDYGIPGGDTAMARTVSLPVAIGVRLVLEGRVDLTGVRIPDAPALYLPILEEMESFGVACREEWGPRTRP